MLCDCVVLRDHSFCPSFGLSFFLSISPWFEIFFFHHATVHSLTGHSSVQYPCLHEYECISSCYVFCSHLSLNSYLVRFSLSCLLVPWYVASCRIAVGPWTLLRCSFSTRASIAIGSINNALFYEQWPLRTHFYSTLLYISICPIVLESFNLKLFALFCSNKLDSNPFLDSQHRWLCAAL